MLIKEVFATKIQEKIEPVIKVGELANEAKLAQELNSYVVTPKIEEYLENFLEHYTDTFYSETGKIGVWISGYFGSGKSYLAKIIGLLTENRQIQGINAVELFPSRLDPDSIRTGSIKRHLSRMKQCDTQVMAFNINSLTDSKTTHLARLLLSQFHQSKGYSSNLLYSSVIESELDKRGKLLDLYSKIEEKTGRDWEDIRTNLSFYQRQLNQAICETIPDVFTCEEDIFNALRTAEQGQLFNIQFLVQTLLQDIEERQKELNKSCRMVFVLDETGQWIEDESERLYQLQALVEEAAKEARGKIWFVITTHEDIGSVYQNARALQADMKKIESRFRYKCPLTTENIEEVLKERIFKKTISGVDEIKSVYNRNSGILRDLGELKNSGQKLPSCDEDNFVMFYPFMPYHIHLIPDLVKSLRSHGGRGEQLSGSTRTLLAVTQDVISSGRRQYLDLGVGELVSFDEIYANLAGDAEVPPDVRRELGRITETIHDGGLLTQRVAEVLYLIGEVPYIPRTIDNIARLLLQSTDDDLPRLVSLIQPELEKLVEAKLVAVIGGEYEYLTGERRNFEEAVRTSEAQLNRFQYKAEAMGGFASQGIGFSTVPYLGNEFSVKTYFDDSLVNRRGDVEVRVYSPLQLIAGKKLVEIENESLYDENKYTIFLLSDSVPGFDQELLRYIAMKDVIDNWKGDVNRSQEERTLATEREAKDLKKLADGVRSKINEGLRRSHVIFRGSSHQVVSKPNQTVQDTLRAEIAEYWPKIYSKYDKVPVRLSKEQQAIIDILNGRKSLPAEVVQLQLFDKSGQINAQSPLLSEIRIFLSTRKQRQLRTLGKDFVDHFSTPPYGWQDGVVRTGVAALVRSGDMSLLIGKKPYRNPIDRELQAALRNIREFVKVELVIEDVDVDHQTLIDVRSLLITLKGSRDIDETSVALSTEFESLSDEVLQKARQVELWANGAKFPVPPEFEKGKSTIETILDLTNPISRVNEIHANRDEINVGVISIRALADFQEKSGSIFVNMHSFWRELGFVKYQLPKDGNCRLFLDEFDGAYKAARVADSNVWKELQGYRSQAEFELNSLKNSWKEEAKKKVLDAIASISETLSVAGLDQELEDELAKPLNDWLDNLESITGLAEIANLPTDANRLIFSLELRIKQKLAEKRPPPPPQKPVEQVRVQSYFLRSRISDVDEWEKLMDKLDSKVKELLKSGKDVELV